MEQEQTITSFLNSEYKSYARYVVENRAIPHFADGLKPVQRKALCGAIRYCYDKPLKVSALGGKVTGDLAYAHGDTSIQGAIVVMAQEFMMAMPWLDRKGQFGYLYDKRPGAPRYIFVKLSGWSKLLLKDDAELHYKFDEDTGDKIEPQFYLPILPMLLINGTNGIAVGYSTAFQNRNPLEVALVALEYLKNGKVPEYNIAPYANGHTGIWSWWNGQFEHCGPWHRKNNTTFVIDGLPINTTLEKYRGYLNSLIDQGFIKKYDDLSSNGSTIFEVHTTQAVLDRWIADNAIPAIFRLIYRLPTDNLTCIMPNNEIKRFNSPVQFIREFVDFRLQFYAKRKHRLINDANARIHYLDDLIRFIDLVNDGTITFKGKTKRQLEAELAAFEIDKAVLNVQVYNLTEDNKNKHVHERARLAKELEAITNTTERQMYINDLEELIGHIRKFYKIEPVLNIKHELLLRPEQPAM
jgi:DNA topoisomerase-2